MGAQKSILGVMPISVTTYYIYFVYILPLFLIVKTTVTDIHVHYSLCSQSILKNDLSLHTKILYGKDKPATLLS